MMLHELESQLISLSPADKARMLQTLVYDLTNSWPGIEKTSGVAGGAACIVRTRIPVWTLEGYRRLDWDDQDILDNFPTLRPSDLIHAWAYVATHRAEIDEALRQNQEA